MNIIELILIALGLSMDAFAVAICKGLNMRKMNYKDGSIIACFFGFFQGLMPLLGWLIGVKFEKYIISIDHWVAFIVLLIIGSNMIRGSLNDKGEDSCSIINTSVHIKELFLLAIATSIDALAVGITLAFLRVSILKASTVIGIITFGISFLGVFIGQKFGCRYKKNAEIAGGIVLIIIGCKILIDHLGIIHTLNIL